MDYMKHLYCTMCLFFLFSYVIGSTGPVGFTFTSKGIKRYDSVVGTQQVCSERPLLSMCSLPQMSSLCRSISLLSISSSPLVHHRGINSITSDARAFGKVFVEHAGAILPLSLNAFGKWLHIRDYTISLLVEIKQWGARGC